MVVRIGITTTPTVTEDRPVEPLNRAYVDAVVKERTRVRETLIAQGWTVPASEANFIWLRLGDDTAAFAEACAAEGVAVRPFHPEGARVSIGDPDANDAFLTAAAGFSPR